MFWLKGYSVTLGATFHPYPPFARLRPQRTWNGVASVCLYCAPFGSRGQSLSPFDVIVMVAKPSDGWPKVKRSGKVPIELWTSLTKDVGVPAIYVHVYVA